MPLLTCVSAVAPPLSLSVSPVEPEVPVCPHPSVCPSGHQALPSGIGPFFERSIDILRRPSAHAADASPACRQEIKRKRLDAMIRREATMGKRAVEHVLQAKRIGLTRGCPGLTWLTPLTLTRGLRVNHWVNL